MVYSILTTSTSLSLLLFFVTLTIQTVYGHDGEQECSHGILFISEAGDATIPAIHVYPITDDLSYLTKSSTLTGFDGKFGQYLSSTESGKFITSTYYGDDALGYKDGVVNFINTGISTSNHDDHVHINRVEPTIVSDTKILCGPVYHAWSHLGRITLFCDGAKTMNITSTYYVLDESLIGTGTNAILYNQTLDGSHHGMAVPIDTSHILHSLYDPAHEWGSDFFAVTDLQGTTLTSLDNITDPNSHCGDYHGGGVVDNTVVMCCYDKVLGVDLDPDTDTVSTRVLYYPETTLSELHRCGDAYTSNMNKYAITDYSDWEATPVETHLMSFPMNATDITEADVLIVDYGGVCKIEFEKSTEKHIVTIARNGTVLVYQYGRPNGWKMVASVPGEQFGIKDCKNATLAVGYMHFFINVPSTKKLYSIDMTYVNIGILKTTSIDLPYTPGPMVVSGVPTGLGCAEFKDTVPPPTSPVAAPTSPESAPTSSSSSSGGSIQFNKVNTIVFIVIGFFSSNIYTMM
jgi:hypothetical protein